MRDDITIPIGSTDRRDEKKRINTASFLVYTIGSFFFYNWRKFYIFFQWICSLLRIERKWEGGFGN
jgi:hypothetical protein